MARNQILYLVLIPSAVAGVMAYAGLPEPPTAAVGDALVVKMEDCKAARPATLRSDTSVLSILFSGRREEELTKRGVIEVGGRKYTLYLPKATPYATKNDKPSDSGLENTSTLISV